MNMLPFYMFLEATGTMALYQSNMKFVAQMAKAFQPTVKKVKK